MSARFMPRDLGFILIGLAIGVALTSLAFILWMASMVEAVD